MLFSHHAKPVNDKWSFTINRYNTVWMVIAYYLNKGPSLTFSFSCSHLNTATTTAQLQLHLPHSSKSCLNWARLHVSRWRCNCCHCPWSPCCGLPLVAVVQVGIRHRLFSDTKITRRWIASYRQRSYCILYSWWLRSGYTMILPERRVGSQMGTRP